MKNKTLFRFSGALLMMMAAGILSSCVSDEQPVNGKPVAESEMMTIQVAVPGNSKPATRALSAPGEYDVDEITVLAFDTDDQTFYGSYAGKVTGGPTGTPDNGPASATMTIKVALPLGKFDLMVVANANAMLTSAASTLVKGKTKEEVVKAIQMTMPGTGWNVDPSSPTPIPMWGYKRAVNVPEDFTDANTMLPSRIYLTRMVAKVELRLGQELIDAHKFKLQTVRVYNYISQGRLVPDISTEEKAAFWDGIDSSTDLDDVHFPTLPEGVTLPESGTKYIDYTLGVDATSLERTIYLFEAPAGVGLMDDPDDYLKNVCLVIGGVYDESGEGDYSGAPSYYRIDFANDADTDPDDDVHDWEFLPLLRNNSYSVNILDITGEGYNSAPDALGSVSGNINVDILDWNNENITTIVTNGMYMLGVSQGSYEFAKDAYSANSTNNYLTVVTDYHTGWTAAVWADVAGETALPNDGLTGQPWLRLTAPGGNGNYPYGDDIQLIVDPNDSGDARTGYIHVKAGALNYIVEVTQISWIVMHITITAPGTVDPVDRLEFEAANPASQQFTVTWEPAANDVTIIKNIPDDATPFTWQDITSALTTIPGNGTGSFTFTVDPTSNTSTTKARESLLTFVIVDEVGGRSATADITLFQNIVPPPPGPTTGVEIGNYIWAEKNVGTPKKFVSVSTDPGRLYQFASKASPEDARMVGWAGIDINGTLRTIYNRGESAGINAAGRSVDIALWSWVAGNNCWSPAGGWLPEADPCPTGWHIPTKAEAQNLVNNTTYSYTKLNGKNGYLLTAKNGGAQIFLPVTKYRYDKAGTMGNIVNDLADYWTASVDEHPYVATLSYFSVTHGMSRTNNTQNAQAVRCVRPKTP